MKQLRFILILALISVILPSGNVFGQDLLTPEESLWLKSRNNTIVFYPEQNNPPYSYQSSAGNIQGLSVDYIELISEKIGANIEYLAPRSRIQILEDMKAGKGDIFSLTPDKEREDYLRFTASYITVPGVLVVRKDVESKSGLTPNDYNGKRLAVVDGSALENYIRTNYPRVVVEEVTDDEVALQQIVLGEVDAAAMDVASLSYYLSKQVLSSVKIVGNTGFDYSPAFGVHKDKQILQSILEKGLSQISTNDRALLSEKWIAVPGQQVKQESVFDKIKNYMGVATLVTLLVLGVIGIILLAMKRKRIFPNFPS